MEAKKKTVVLVVEDDPTSGLLYGNFLELKGFEVMLVTNGRDAINAVTGNPDIRIILMDIRLPEMDGIRTMQEIKKIRADIPIIAQTAYAMANDKKQLLQAGFDNYLSKPIKPAILYEVLLTYLK
jgi:CheY-like chemotaxis protein